jgi:hypothetical protein
MSDEEKLNEIIRKIAGPYSPLFEQIRRSPLYKEMIGKISPAIKNAKKMINFVSTDIQAKMFATSSPSVSAELLTGEEKDVKPRGKS